MKIRIVLTLITLVLWALLSFALSVSAPLVSSALAVRQFDDSNTGYVISRFADWFTGAGPSSLILVAVLAAIWWRPLVTFVTTIALASLLFASSAQAYYDKSDYSEAYFILPNESAFFIPDVGANKEGQAKFGSQDYYEQNKIPAKRFVIPHAKFSGSGMWSDLYVPTGRLIIVDRTPYNREWTASQHRGSSARDESFPCQSSEGLNITVEMAVSATVSEENAARFLYHFGVKAPQGDRSKPEVIFTSVFYGRSLPEVMDFGGPRRSSDSRLRRAIDAHARPERSADGGDPRCDPRQGEGMVRRLRHHHRLSRLGRHVHLRSGSAEGDQRSL